MAILYINLDVDNIPGYIQNDINHPLGWVDYKTIFPTLYSDGVMHTLYLKGTRDDPTYNWKCSMGGGSVGGTTIYRWPGETEPWRLRVKNLDYTSHGNGRFHLNNGIIYLVEDPITIGFTTMGTYLFLTDCFFKCRNFKHDSWSPYFEIIRSAVICNQFLSGATYLKIQNSMICCTSHPANIVVSGSSLVDKSIFNTSNFFSGTNVTADNIFDYNAPITWPDLNDPKSAFAQALYSISSIKPFKFKDVDITNTNCNINNIKIVSKNDKLHVFSNNTYKYAHSEYSVNSTGELVKDNDDYFINGLYIKNHFDNNIILSDIRPYNNNIGIVRLLKDNSFSITSKDKSIIFNPDSDFQSDYLNKNYSPSDIYGPIIKNIFVSKDVVTFNGIFNSIYGLNLSTNPLKYFSRFYNTKINSTYVKEINSVKEFIGIDYDKGFIINDTNKEAFIINNVSNAEIIYNSITTVIENTKILGACFHDNDIFYVKIKNNSSELITEENINLICFPILCSLKYGELIEFKIKIPSNKIFVGNSSIYDEYINFKSIKSINNELIILFNNYYPLNIDKSNNYKLYIPIISKYGIITSLDYINNSYIVGISKYFTKNFNKDIYGNCLLRGENLSDLYTIETCLIKDIIVDKYRELIYISTKFDFRIYDYSMNLLKTYRINPINNEFYNKIDYKNRFFLHSDVSDIRKIIGSIDEKLYINDTIIFNDSIEEKNKKIICTSNKKEVLISENSKTIIFDNMFETSYDIDFHSLPLFSNNLNGYRTEDVFSIFSKDEVTGIIVEFSYSNNLIITIPNKNNLHDKKRIVIDTEIVPINGEIPYNYIGLKIKNNYIIFRIGSSLRIYTIDFTNGEITLAYSTILSQYDYPEIQSCIEINSKILIPLGSSSILELNHDDTSITFNRYVDVTDSESNLINIHQLELFNNIPVCIYSKNNENGYFGFFNISEDNNFSVIPVRSSKIFINDTVIPLLKINNDKLSIIYNESLVLSFDKTTVCGNKYLNNSIEEICEKLEFNSNKNTVSIEIDNESIRNSKNRNFVKSNTKDKDTYVDLYKSTTGIIRDFDSNLIYSIIKDNGNQIVISDVFTDRKRIDILISMENSNTVKRIKTDRFDINIDNEIYPKISAYLKDATESELNKLCSLILK